MLNILSAVSDSIYEAVLNATAYVKRLMELGIYGEYESDELSYQYFLTEQVEDKRKHLLRLNPFSINIRRRFNEITFEDNQFHSFIVYPKSFEYIMRKAIREKNDSPKELLGFICLNSCSNSYYKKYLTGDDIRHLNAARNYSVSFDVEPLCRCFIWSQKFTKVALAIERSCGLNESVAYINQVMVYGIYGNIYPCENEYPEAYKTFCKSIGFHPSKE